MYFVQCLEFVADVPFLHETTYDVARTSRCNFVASCVDRRSKDGERTSEATAEKSSKSTARPAWRE